MKYDNILQTIGQTPTVQLHHFDRGQADSLWVKLESFNPGGSVKDRPALNMIEDAEARGILKPGDTLIEPTSGNTGIGLAMVAAVKGYPAIFVMSADMSEERKAILCAFGAELILTPADKGTVGAIEEARRLSRRSQRGQVRRYESGSDGRGRPSCGRRPRIRARVGAEGFEHRSGWR